MKFIRILGLLCMLVQVVDSFSQTDTSFWFAAPELSAGQNLDRPVFLRLVAGTQPATVTITQPAGGGMPTQTLNLNANSLASVDLTPWIDLLECKPGNTVLNTGLNIRASTPISAYYEVIGADLNPEMFVLKGRNALGYQFLVSAQTTSANNAAYTPLPFSSFNIIATEDSTVVTIRASADIVGHVANVLFNIQLDKGQTYAAIAASGLPAGHLAGSQVSASKPIAITISDDLVTNPFYGGCADVIGEQTVPVSVVGSQYIAVNGQLFAPHDQVFITAINNGTQVFRNGVLLTTLNATATYMTDIGGDACYITTSSPAYVYQMTGIGCEFGATVLPRLDCTGSRSVRFARSSNEQLHLNIVTKTAGINGFTLNGSTAVLTAAMFDTVPGTNSEWSFTSTELPLSAYPAGSVIHVRNQDQLFHLGILNGGAAGGTTVGYFSDYGNALNAHIIASDTILCAGETLVLSTSDAGSLIWQGPHGYISTADTAIITNMTSEQEGYYRLTTDIPGCGFATDSVYVRIAATADTSVAVQICEGVSFLGHSESGNYTDTLNTVDGCDSVVHLALSVRMHSGYDTTVTICSEQYYYAGGAMRNQAGWYTDTFRNAAGCDSVVRTRLEIEEEVKRCHCFVQIPNAFTPNGDGINDDFKITVNPDCVLKRFALTIYNRWGERVFQTMDISHSWNGHTGSRPADIGTYMFIAEWTSSFSGKAEQVKGDLILLR
jgi:gliding motility-associated-like protein